MYVLPVIHHLDYDTSLKQAQLAFDACADGVFLISHDGFDAPLPGLARRIKLLHQSKLVGINLLSTPIVRAAQLAMENSLDMVWGDNCGVDSFGLDRIGDQLARLVRGGRLQVFASVAFKYQPTERSPIGAALCAQGAGFIPTTSGPATGEPPALSKITDMCGATLTAKGKCLAIASGMTPENISLFAPHLSHVLVATGVSMDMHHFDYEALRRFIALARAAGGQ